MEFLTEKDSPLPSAAAAETVPQLEPILAFLAGGYLRYGQWKKARPLLATLHRLCPDKAEYRIGLGLACFKDGRTEEALAHLDQTVGRMISQDVRAVPVWQALLLCHALKANGMTNHAVAIFSFRINAEDLQESA